MTTPDILTSHTIGKGADWNAYLDVFRTGHTVRSRVYVMDASEVQERGWEISDQVLSGQVDVDTENDPARRLSLSVLDPRHKIAVTDTSATAYGHLWVGSIIRVWYDVVVPDRDTIVEWPVFTGPVIKLSRQGAEVTIEAVGKEIFMMKPSVYNHVFSKAGVDATDKTREAALRALLDAIGEPQSLLWQGNTDHLPKHFDPQKMFHKAENSYLKLARQIAGQHLFYFDGYGRPVCRQPHGGAYSLVGLELTEATSSFDLTDIRNRARAHVQKKPAHKDGDPPAPVIYTITRKPVDPLSAQSLKRNGVARYLDADNDSKDYKKANAAKAAAKKELAGYSEEVELDIIPVPFLDPYDTVIVEQHGEGSGTLKFKVHKYSFPLHTGDSMSIGYNRRLLDPKHTKARHRRLRRKHHHRRNERP